MKMELTERDKKLLVGLSIFVLVVCIGYWGIRPQLKKAKSYKNEIEKQEEIKQVNESKISQVSMLETDNANKEQQILKAREKYYKLMTSDEIDKYFTGKALDYGLYAYSLSIDIPEEETDLEPYVYSEKAIQAKAEEDPYSQEESQPEDLFEQYAGDDGLAELYQALGKTGIYPARVTMKLGGEESKLLKLIDDFSSTDQKLRICSYSWDKEDALSLMRDTDGNEILSYDVVEKDILTITVEIYMCEE